MRKEDISSLLSCLEFLFHCGKAGCRFCITHVRVLEPGEPFTHKVRAFPAVGELAFRYAVQNGFPFDASHPGHSFVWWSQPLHE